MHGPHATDAQLSRMFSAAARNPIPSCRPCQEHNPENTVVPRATRQGPTARQSATRDATLARAVLGDGRLDGMRLVRRASGRRWTQHLGIPLDKNGTCTIMTLTCLKAFSQLRSVFLLGLVTGVPCFLKLDFHDSNCELSTNCQTDASHPLPRLW